jgi:hypothetical protein
LDDDAAPSVAEPESVSPAELESAEVPDFIAMQAAADSAEAQMIEARAVAAEYEEAVAESDEAELSGHAARGFASAEPVAPASDVDVEAGVPPVPEHDEHVEPLAAAGELAEARWEPAPLPAQPPTPTPTGNGVKPPRDLMRVPDEFRRMPPGAGRVDRDTATPPQPIEPPAARSTPQTPASPEPEPEPEDDAAGVPSVPWSFASPPAPAAAAEPAPAEDEELGVPFGPFTLPDDSVDLPKPPAVAEQPLHPLPGTPTAAELFITPSSAADAQAGWPPPSNQDPFPIAPLEGFHLTDPAPLEFSPGAADNPFAAPDQPGQPAAAVHHRSPAQTAAPQHQSQPQPQPADSAADPDAVDDGSWRIRQSPRAQLLAERMAQKRREETARAAFEAASIVNEPERGRRKRRERDDSPPDLPTARRQLDEHLRKKRGAEAGALLQRLAQEVGGRDIADLALDAGDRCRALGQSRSATNCYLAAWRADPLYETPLWRLSDVCLNDQEIDLAVGYLERIAELMRSRGDDEGAIGVYRKIAMIAPERQDVRDVIRLAKTTGRLDG